MRKRKGKRRGRKSLEELRRRRPSRPPRALVLIVCEGKETEPRYFRALRTHKRLSAEIEIVGAGADPSKVVEDAARLREKYPRECKAMTGQRLGRIERRELPGTAQERQAIAAELGRKTWEVFSD